MSAKSGNGKSSMKAGNLRMGVQPKLGPGCTGFNRPGDEQDRLSLCFLDSGFDIPPSPVTLWGFAQNDLLLGRE